MTQQARSDTDPEQLSAAVARIIETGGDLQARIRDLMLAAFSSGQLDRHSMRTVTRAVIDGIASSVDSAGIDAVRQSLGGVGAALLQAAEASRLAIEEAAGRAAEFRATDLQRAGHDLAAIEQLFADTLHEAAAAGTVTASAIFNDYLRHITRGSHDFGQRLQEIVHELERTLPDGGRKGLQAGMGLAQATTGELSRLANAALSALRDRATGPNERDADGPDSGEAD